MVAVDYNKLLEANKKAYEKGDINQDKYQGEARKIRRLRRKAGQAPSQKNGNGPKKSEGSKKKTTSGRKKRTRNKKTVLSIPMDIILEEARAAFKKAKMKRMKKAKLDKLFHGFTSVSMKSIKEENPEIDVGEMVIEKFTSRWARKPIAYAEVLQGGSVIFYVGDVDEK